MRMMMKVSIPTHSGNHGVKDGSLPKTVMGFVEKFKPEASYFTAIGGHRTAIFVVDIKDASMIPSLAEPFFQNLNAEIELTPTMNLEELKTGVDLAMKG